MGGIRKPLGCFKKCVEIRELSAPEKVSQVVDAVAHSLAGAYRIWESSEHHTTREPSDHAYTRRISYQPTSNIVSYRVTGPLFNFTRVTMATATIPGRLLAHFRILDVSITRPCRAMKYLGSSRFAFQGTFRVQQSPKKNYSCL